MKKKIILSSLLLIFLMAISCSKEKVDIETSSIDMYDKVAIENATQAEKEAYAKFHLLKVASYLDLKLSNKSINNQILSKGYSNGNNKFIYAKELISSIQNQIEKESKNVIVEEIKKSLNAFENLDGENWQVTISIPNYKSITLNRVIDETQPIFVLSVDTEKEVNSDEVDGYQKNEDDIMEKLNTKVDEDVVENNTVYKIGVSVYEIRDNNGDENSGENSGNSGNNDGNIGAIGTVVTPGQSSGSVLPSQSGLTIRYMRALLKKESFIECNEVHFNGYQMYTYVNNSDVNDLVDISGSSTDGWCGQKIQSFDSADISNGTTFFVNFLINGSYHILPGTAGGTGSYVYYLIFEHDNWPAPLREKNFQFSDLGNRVLQYRSHEPMYDSAILWNPIDFFSPNPTPFPSTADPYVISNSQIIYHLRRTI